MALEEEQLNGRIASIINELAKSSGWVAREELWNALRGPRSKPDILITREDAPPIVIENECREVGIIRLAFGGGGDLVFHAGKIPSFPSFIKHTLSSRSCGKSGSRGKPSEER